MILAFLAVLVAPCTGGDRVAVGRGETVEINVGAIDLQVKAHPRDEIVLPHSGATCEKNGGVYRVDLRAAPAAVSLGVPAWMPVKVIGADGQVEITGTRAPVDIATEQGDVVVDGGREHVTISSSGGTVTVRDARGVIDIEVQHRPLLVEGSSGDFRILNVTGITTLKDVEARQLNASTVTGEINCQCAPTDGAEWLMRAHTGAVRLSLPASARATLTLDAPPHAADVRFPGASVNQIDSRQLSVTVGGGGGGGGARIRLSSFSGEVELAADAHR